MSPDPRFDKTLNFLYPSFIFYSVSLDTLCGIMYLCPSYDHRIIMEALAVYFLQTDKKTLENTTPLLLGMRRNSLPRIQLRNAAGEIAFGNKLRVCRSGTDYS